jgi:hypothetical protein
MLSNYALAAGLLVPVILVEVGQPPQPDRPRDQQPKETQPMQPKPGSMSAAEDPAFRDTLAAQEKRVWEAMKAGDWKAVEAMTSERFTAICPTGFQTRTQAIEDGKKNKLTAYTLSEWKSIKLDNNSGVIMYKAECTGTPGEGGTDKQVGYHSTVWRREGNNWLADMHQATVHDPSMKR